MSTFDSPVKEDASDGEWEETGLQDCAVSLAELKTMKLRACDDEGVVHGVANRLHGLFVVSDDAPPNGCDQMSYSELVAGDDGDTKSVAASWGVVPFTTRITKSTFPPGETPTSWAATVFENEKGTKLFYILDPEIELDCIVQTCNHLVERDAIVAASDPSGPGTASLPEDARRILEGVPMYSKFPLSPSSFSTLSPAAKVTKPKAVVPKVSVPKQPAASKRVSVKATATKSRPTLNLTGKASVSSPLVPKSKPKSGAAAPKVGGVKRKAGGSKEKKTKAEEPEKKAKVEPEQIDVKPVPVGDVCAPVLPTATIPEKKVPQSPVRWKLIIEGEGPMSPAALRTLSSI